MQRYVSLNWNSSGGGAFAILPLPSPFTPLPTAALSFPVCVCAGAEDVPVPDPLPLCDDDDEEFPPALPVLLGAVPVDEGARDVKEKVALMQLVSELGLTMNGPDWPRTPWLSRMLIPSWIASSVRGGGERRGGEG